MSSTFRGQLTHIYSPVQVVEGEEQPLFREFRLVPFASIYISVVPKITNTPV